MICLQDGLAKAGVFLLFCVSTVPVLMDNNTKQRNQKPDGLRTHAGSTKAGVSVCVCVRARARARVRACVRACVCVYLQGDVINGFQYKSIG